MKFARDLRKIIEGTSLPSRERGLKSDDFDHISVEIDVAPFTGAWIEILYMTFVLLSLKVAPFTGAWIEIGTGGARM